MEDNRFLFCPSCGGRGIQTLLGGRKWFCPDCGLDLYNNVAAAVGLIIRNGKGELLFERRAKEPRKGFLAFPGGFAEPDESGEEAALRECEEEIGVKPLAVRYVCSFPNTYVYKSIIYKTCDMFFSAELPEHFVLKAQPGEVSSFEWRRVADASDVEALPLAFVSARNTLLRWLELR
ncbi:MAG TPA: NUDIX hydrolase [Treponema sp.]|nr:NUDIX hydrolase [Treponema sp.]